MKIARHAKKLVAEGYYKFGFLVWYKKSKTIVSYYVLHTSESIQQNNLPSLKFIIQRYFQNKNELLQRL